MESGSGRGRHPRRQGVDALGGLPSGLKDTGPQIPGAVVAGPDAAETRFRPFLHDQARSSGRVLHAPQSRVESGASPPADTRMTPLGIPANRWNLGASVNA
jgi:hypothetical protein